VNGLTLVALIAIAIGAFVAYRLGVRSGRRESLSGAWRAATPPVNPPAMVSSPGPASEPPGERQATADDLLPLRDELSTLRQALDACERELVDLRAALPAANAETARYRQIIVDIEDRAPPPLLDSPHAPDDLRLIVGVGPVLERMLQQMGIGTYRQIARWSERDIDEFDARLPEFHGRIRRDGWVTQARELHQSKYGERL
jgi:NADH-quinone oxidoreductase subunit E